MKIFNCSQAERNKGYVRKKTKGKNQFSKCEGLMHWFLVVGQGTVQIRWKVESNAVSLKLL